MVVAVDNAASKGGSGPSSPQSFVSRSTSSVGSHDSEKSQKTEKEKVELLGPETCPNNERKLGKMHARDDRQTLAADPHAPCFGLQHMPAMPQLYYQLSPYVTCDYNEILEKDRKIDNLQDQLHERDQTIMELEMKLENKKGEVFAKDSSLREKEAELATCRKNLDHCETEKRRLEEMHRTSQGSIFYENEQLKMELAQHAGWYRQHWMMTIEPLQAELAAHTQQVNQLLLVQQRQVERSGRLERQLLREMADNRRLRLEMANTRERTQTHPDESHIPQNSSQDVTELGQNNGNQLDVNGGGSMNTNSGVLLNGNTDNATSFVSSGNASTQAALEVSQISAPSQTDQNLSRSDAKYEHEKSVDGQALHSGHLNVHISPETEPDSVISPSAGEEQVLSQENDTNTTLVYWGSTGLTLDIRLDTIGQNSDAKEQQNLNLTDRGLQGEVAKVEEPSLAADASVSI